MVFIWSGGGVTGFRKKATRLTKEGKKMLRLYDLHSKVQKEMTELGGKIYDLTSKKNKNPMLDRKVKAIVRKIETYEEKIARLEGIIKKTKLTPLSYTAKNISPQRKSNN